MAAWLEYGVGLVMGGEEPLRLAGGLEPAHNFLSSSRRPVTTLNPVVTALRGLVVCIGGLMGNRLDVAPQFVCHDDPWLTKLRDQPRHEMLGSFRIAMRLHKNIKRVAVGIDRPTEPVFQPLMGITTSSRCHLPFGRGRSRRMQAAK